MTISSANDFYMSPSAVSLTLNAMGSYDTLSVSVYAGAKVSAYHKGIIDYTPANEYPQWTITAFNTYFEDTRARYMHIALSRTTDVATIVYPDTLLDLYGRAVTDDGTAYIVDSVDENGSAVTTQITEADIADESKGLSAPSTDGDFYFLFLAKITSSEGPASRYLVNLSGSAIDSIISGNLDTAQYREEEMQGVLSKMFEYVSATGAYINGAIRQLRPIIESHIVKLFVGDNGDGKSGKLVADLQRTSDDTIYSTDSSNNLIAQKQVTYEEGNTTMVSVDVDADTVVPSVAYMSKFGGQQYLSKQHDDTASGRITFNDISLHSSDDRSTVFSQADIPTVGSGWKVDSNGNIIAESLVLRESLTVPELRYNRITTLHGVQWHTVGSNKIKSVTIEDIDDPDNEGEKIYKGTITLDLEDGEFGSLKVGDKCMGIWHQYDHSPSDGYDTSLDNATQDSDEHNGNFHFAGFQTIYFIITNALNADGDNDKFEYELRCTEERLRYASDSKEDKSEGGTWGGRTLWTDASHPQPEMHVAAYANAEDGERQACQYETLTYKIQLVGMTDWIYSGKNIIKVDGQLDGFTIPTFYYDENGNKVDENLELQGWGIAIGNIYMWGSTRTVHRDKILVSQQLYFMTTADELTDVTGTHGGDWLTYYSWSKDPQKPDSTNTNLYEYWHYTYADGTTENGTPFWVSNYATAAVNVVFKHDVVPVYCRNIAWGDNIYSEDDGYIYAEYDQDIENEVYLYVGDGATDISSAEVSVDMSGQPNALAVDGVTTDQSQVLSYCEYEGGKIKIGIIAGAFRIDENVDVAVTVHYGAGKSAVGHFLLAPNYEGADGGEGGSGVSSFTSFVFKRSSTTPDSLGREGSYANPVPSGWSDSVPAATSDPHEVVWMSSRVFYSDNRDTKEWSTPVIMADTADFEVIYSEKATPNAPVTHPFDGTADIDWIDDVSSESVIWMATSRFVGGAWKDWEVVKIKGEPGAPGDSYSLTEEYYYASVTKEEALPSHTFDSHADWSTTVPANYSSERPYLWNFEIVYYKDTNATVQHTDPTAPQMISFWGQSGRGIGKVVEKYIAKAEDEDAPSSFDEGFSSTMEAGFSADNPKLYNREIIYDTDNVEINRTDWQLISHWGELGESAVVADLSNEVDTIGVGSDGILDVITSLSTTLSLYVGVDKERITSLVPSIVGGYSDMPVTVTPETATVTENVDGVDKEVTYYTGKVDILLDTESGEEGSKTLNKIDFNNTVTKNRFVVRLSASSANVATSVVKDFTIFASRDAKDGSLFRLVPSVDSVIVTKSSDNKSSYSVSSVSCSRYIAEGGGGLELAESNGSVFYRIYKNVSGTISTDGYVPYTDAVPVNVESYTSVEFTWFVGATATGVIYDRESVPLVRWGDNGVVFSADLSNETDAIGVGSDSILDVETSLSTTFSLFYGPTQMSLSSLSYVVNGIGGNSPSLVGVVTDKDSGLVTVTVSKDFDFSKCVSNRFYVKVIGSCSGLSSPISKEMTIVGNPDAEDGEVRFVSPSVSSVVVSKVYDAQGNESNSYSVSSVSCDRRRKIGSSDAESVADGYLFYRKDESGNYVEYVDAVSVNENDSSITFYWYSSCDVNAMTGVKSPSGTLHDHETVPIIHWGKQGEKGETGAGVKVRNHYASIEALLSDYNGGKNASFQPEDGDGYIVDDTGHLWVWSDEATSDATYYKFIDCGQIQGDPGVSEYLHIAWSHYKDGKNNGITDISTSPVDGAAYEYMGTCHSTDKTDPTDADSYTWVYTKGETGRNITSVENRYQWALDGTTAPSNSSSADIANWSLNAIPTHPDGKDYLWNYETNLSDSQAVSTSSPTCIGYFPKDGLGIKSIDEYYLLGSSTIPVAPSLSGDKTSVDYAITYESVSKTWSKTSQNPTTDNRYVWNVEVTLMSDDTYRVGSVHLSCVRGEDGANVKVKGHYASKDALNEAISSGELTPKDGDGYYADDTHTLWVWSTESSTWIDCGDFQGEQGKTYYLHIAWSNYANGKDGDGNPSYSIEKESGHSYAYIGTCTNEIELDVEVPFDDYVWVEIKGDKGNVGPQGADAYTLDLSNEMDSVPADKDGNVTTESLVSTMVSFFKGASEQTLLSSDDTSTGTGVAISCDASDKCSSTENEKSIYYNGEQYTTLCTTADQFKSSGGKFDLHISKMYVDKVEITFTADYYVSGVKLSTKYAVLTINRVKAGKNGENAIIYNILPSVSSIVKSNTGDYFPPSGSGLKATIIRKDGSSVEEITEEISGYHLEYYIDNDSSNSYSLGVNYAVPFGEPSKSVTICLYEESVEGQTLIDMETIPVVKDGEDGALPYTFDLTNEMDSVPVNSSGNTVAVSVSTTATFFFGPQQIDNILSKAPQAGETGVIIYAEYDTDDIVFDGLTDDYGNPLDTVYLASTNGIFSYKVTSIVADKVDVIFHAIYYASGTKIVEKDAVFTINKIKPGANGETPTVYNLKPNYSSIKKDKSGYYYPASCDLLFTILATKGGVTTEITTLDGYSFGFYVDDIQKSEQECDPDSDIDFGAPSKSVTIVMYQGSFSSASRKVIDIETIPVVSDGADGESTITLVAEKPSTELPLYVDDNGKNCLDYCGDAHNIVSLYFTMHFGETAISSFDSINATVVLGTEGTNAAIHINDSTPAKGMIDFVIEEGYEMNPLLWEFLVTGTATYNGKTKTRTCRISFTGVTAGQTVQGPQGVQGCVVRDCGEWNKDTVYYNDSSATTIRDTSAGVRFIDMVHIGSGSNITYWIRTTVSTNYVKTDDSYPAPEDGSAFWYSGGHHDFIASDVIWTKDEWAEHLSGKSMYVVDPDDSTVVGGMQSESGDVPMLFAGATKSNASNANFRVWKNGSLYAKGAEIEGKITATSGTIGGFAIGSATDATDGDDTSDAIIGYGSSFWASTPDRMFAAGTMTSYIYNGGNLNGSLLPSAKDNLHLNSAKVASAATCTLSLNSRNDIAFFGYASGGIDNFAFMGYGDIVTNGKICQAYKPDYQNCDGKSNINLVFEGQTVIISNVGSSGCNVYLPRLNNVLIALGVSSSSTDNVYLKTTFAVRILIKNVSRNKATVKGKSSEKSVTSSDNYPTIYDENMTFHGSGMSLDKGDAIEFLLYFDGTNYAAHIICHND